MQKIKIVLLSAILLASTSLFAQWECPSRIGGNLKPFTSAFTNLSWASELTSSMGYAGDDYISNIMAFGALDLSFDKFTFYAEGGLKRWKRFDGKGYENFATNFGMREAFFQYRGTNQTLNLGLRSTQGDDYYLINERVMGIDYKQSFGNWNVRALTGSVLDRFARNGTFCTLGYLYNIVPGRERALIGQQFGQTNLAMLTLNYLPGSKTTSNEFATDEFTNNDGLSVATDEFSAPAKKQTQALFKLVNTGALLYTEYGSQIATKALYSGLYAEVEIAGITLKPEVLLQSALNQRALIWNLTAQKQFIWSSGQQTKVFARAIGVVKIDSTANALNSFSNVFAGEVLRMDGIELPIVQAGIKHSIPSLKASIKLQAALQTGETRGYIYNVWNSPPTNDRMQEYDVVLSKNFGNHLLVNAHGGYLIYPRMTGRAYVYETNKTPWGKVEIRYTF